MLIGYARVSTEDQNLDLQIAALKAAGAGRIFNDKMAGTRADRPGLQDALSLARPGDTVVVWKLDRLGCGVKGLVDLVGDLEKQGVDFRSLTDAIDTSTPAGRIFFHLMASLAQMEREIIQERARAGLAVARAKGRVGGRKRLLTNGKMEAAKTLLAGGTPPKDVAQSLGVSVPTLYRWLPAGERG